MAQSVSSTTDLFIPSILSKDDELARSVLLAGCAMFGLSAEQSTEYADEFINLLRMQRAWDNKDDAAMKDVLEDNERAVDPIERDARYHKL